MKAINIFTLISIGVLFLAFAFFGSIISLVTDWWWFNEVGHSNIFIKSLSSKIVIFLVVSAVSWLFLLFNLILAARSKTLWMVALPGSLAGQPITLNQRLVKKIAVLASFLVAFFLGLLAAANWLNFEKFLSGIIFKEVDPIFGKDIAFYIFSLPVLELGLSLVKNLVLLAGVGSLFIYVLRRRFNIVPFLSKLDYLKLGIPKLTYADKSETDSHARLHLGILLALFLAAMSFDIYLSMFKLLIGQSGPVLGASYTDVNLKLPLLRLSTILVLVASLFSLLWGISGKVKPILVAFGLCALVGLMTAVVPSVYQKLVVAPNELAKETPFIKHNIAATKKAFDLEQIEEREISAEKQLTSNDIAANNLTVKNVRLWDRAPLLSTFSQIQEIRTYYEFTSVDNDRYTIDGEIRQIMLSPRELASDTLPSRTFINERLAFTHGYGVAAGPVNQVTAEGLPVLFVKDLPPKSQVKELDVTRPEIYFGELSNDYVVVKTKAQELDYPKGEDNVYSSYAGRGGVEVKSLLRRILFTLRFGSLKLLLSNDITNESRIMYYRQVQERMQKIAPFLVFDSDPYMVISSGRLYWIMDAYTTSDRYPYSQPVSFNIDSVNYIRNSVKAVVDAYNGNITFYQADMKDPIVNSYAKIFPNTFRPLSDMPKDLSAHLRYPEDIFALQTNIYTLYHMDEPQSFYNREDQWEIPSIGEALDNQEEDKIQTLSPRHMIMKLPNEKKEEFVLMLPFTPKAKDNLAAWMVARNDGDQYGKLLVYRFPKQKLVFGPKQIIGRINQDAEISKQISLWDQRGSQVIQGPLLVIPIEESLIYVRPLYLKAETGKIPELKRVIVAYENQIAMEETLEEGLGKIFGSLVKTDSKPAGGLPTLPEKQTGLGQLLREASEVYEAALKAQREGNWSGYGDHIRRLGEILQKTRP